jgi:hypothetical protein
MFENEHTCCSRTHHVHTAKLLRNWREQRPSNKSDLDSSVMGEVGGLLLISFLYRSA